MIRLETARAAVALAQELSIAGMEISVKPDSDLAALNVTGFLPVNVPVEAVTAELINAQSIIPAVGFDHSEHDATLDKISVSLANIARQRIGFAKNVARVAVKAMIERVQSAVEAIPTTVSFNPNIVEVDLPEPMRGGAMNDVFENAYASQMLPRENLYLGELDDAGIKELLKTGSKILNNEIDVWYARKGVEFFRNVWNAAFSGSYGDAYGSVEAMFGDQSSATDAALAVYLIAKSMETAMPGETARGDIKTIRLLCEEMAGYAVNSIQSDLKRWDFYITSKRVLIGVANIDKEIRVVSPVYRTWLDNGGNKNALIGNCLISRPFTLVDDIDQKTAELIDAWEHHNRVLTRAEVANREVRLGSAFRSCGLSVIHDFKEQLFEGAQDGEVISQDSPSVLNAEKQLEAFVDEMTAKGYLVEKTIWELCTDCITKYILCDTDAHEILNGIDSVMAEYPDLDINEAVNLVVVDYLATYVAGQFNVTDKTTGNPIVIN